MLSARFCEPYERVYTCQTDEYIEIVSQYHYFLNVKQIITRYTLEQTHEKKVLFTFPGVE